MARLPIRGGLFSGELNSKSDESKSFMVVRKERGGCAQIGKYQKERQSGTGMGTDQVCRLLPVAMPTAKKKKKKLEREARE
jgi:hypothetical protein